MLPGLDRPAVHAGERGPGRLIAIDGKTCRRSHDAGHGLGPLHIVSAWATEEGWRWARSLPGRSPTRSPPSPCC